MFLKKYIQAFGYAFAGIASFFRTERNAGIHSLASVVAIAAGVIVEITSNEWLWIFLAITVVFVTEMINTTIEKLCNKISKEIDPDIRIIKDIAAGFVLVSSLFALVVAAIIFAPYLFN
ncbi:MAG: diacylglycerol kinase [Bacteroidetes bacterium]|nr:MAG: diacylglycerol kinase [Bacteroidota bacterium]